MLLNLAKSPAFAGLFASRREKRYALSLCTDYITTLYLLLLYSLGVLPVSSLNARLKLRILPNPQSRAICVMCLSPLSIFFCILDAH